MAATTANPQGRQRTEKAPDRAAGRKFPKRRTAREEGTEMLGGPSTSLERGCSIDGSQPAIQVIHFWSRSVSYEGALNDRHDSRVHFNAYCPAPERGTSLQVRIQRDPMFGLRCPLSAKSGHVQWNVSVSA